MFLPLGFLVRHSLSQLHARVVPNNTTPNDFKKKEIKLMRKELVTPQFQKYWNGRPSLGAKDNAGRSNLSVIDE